MKIPKQYRNVNRHPQPRATSAPLIAPNMQAEVQQTINDHPEIDTMDEDERGAIIDITDWRVNHDREKPWGRKARNNDPNNPNLNTDGMTYLRPDGLFEIYDCISGIDGQSTWEGYGPYAPGENGYWWPPQPVDGDTPTPPPIGDLDQRVTTLEAAVSALDVRVGTLEHYTANLESQIRELSVTVDDLVSRVSQPLHAKGLINVPTVLESLTSLRAIGDIDVNVTIGEAIPPEPASDTTPAHPVLIWRWLTHRRDDEVP